MRGKAVKGEGPIELSIEYSCPQCGAPALLEETDRLFTCAYCRVRSYLSAPHHFRFLLPSRAPASAHLVYLPYWRFRGMLFSCLAAGVRHRFLDLTQLALEAPGLPSSLGVRSQALKLRFLTPKAEGTFVAPALPQSRFMEHLGRRFSGRLPRPLLHQACVGETWSLLYAPFYWDRHLYDGMSRQSLSRVPQKESPLEPLATEEPRAEMHLLSTLCPNCGWDLEGERDTLALLCRNCASLWAPSGAKFERLPFGMLPPEKAPGLALPFWRIEPELRGINLESYADLVRLANLPRAPRPGWEEREFRFWIPAFKVRPQMLLRLATQVTLEQPVEDLWQQLPAGRAYPVTLPSSEALQTAKVILARFLKPRALLVERLPGIEIRARSLMLVWVPFQERPHEYVRPDLLVTLPKNLLKFSRNL